MSRTQLAVVRSLLVGSVLLIMLGFVVWANTGSPILAAFGAILLVVTIIAWVSLTPTDAPRRQADGKRARPGVVLAILVGVVFVIVMGIGAIDIFTT